MQKIVYLCILNYLPKFECLKLFEGYKDKNSLLCKQIKFTNNVKYEVIISLTK